MEFHDYDAKKSSEEDSGRTVLLNLK